MWTLTTCLTAVMVMTPAEPERFDGRFYSGRGDTEYLELLDNARRMFGPDPEFQNVPMLYTPAWNGLVEGPTWGAWWVQNSYGPTYCALPFYTEPLTTFLQNAQDLWFDQMGDGVTPRPHRKFRWVPPDGALCDAASPTMFVAKQGDGRVDIHDWGYEFTAAGLLLQSELLLISRDVDAIGHYLPKLERCARCIEERRDPTLNLFLVGPAANLLAPSYAGWKRPDGTFGRAYLTGLSVTYIAALDRLVELCKLAGQPERAAVHQQHRDSARQALSQLITDEGYFIKSLDPDGTRHGVYGADRFGYFEASPNHDAIAFGVVDDAQAQKIYHKLASIPGLRPHALIIANYPSLDDLYTKPTGLWRFGHWVNGGHWSTCEARMMMAYARLGQYEDARRSMQQLMTFAHRFRMDNPLVDFGSQVYQPGEPINLCYDAFGPPAALVRGLFEYLYRADGLTLVPHIPPGIVELQQKFPIRFGSKRLYLVVTGRGPISAVLINGKPIERVTPGSVFLPYEATPDVATVEIVRGGTSARGVSLDRVAASAAGSVSLPQEVPAELKALRDRAARFGRFAVRLDRAGLGATYEAAHARLAARYVSTILARRAMQATGRIRPLSEASQVAADKSYVDTATRLCAGLEQVLAGYAGGKNARERRIHGFWRVE
ncbi:MAG: hypothetical protein ACC645_18310 [Pirellulales bacterium]